MLEDLRLSGRVGGAISSREEAFRQLPHIRSHVGLGTLLSLGLMQPLLPGPATGAAPPGPWQWGQGTGWDSDGVHPASCETLDSDAPSVCLGVSPAGRQVPLNDVPRTFDFQREAENLEISMLAMHSKFNKTTPRLSRAVSAPGTVRHRTWVGLLCPQHQRRGPPAPKLGILPQWGPGAPRLP